MKQSRKVNGLWETLLIIGLILLIPLFFSIKTRANPQTVQNTAVPVIPTMANAPADSNALKPKQPPACNFPLAQISTEESTPEEYTFSEPQVVLNDSYNLVEWLPDNQRLLMTELSDQTEMGKPRIESIELYNSATGELKVYATRNLY